MGKTKPKEAAALAKEVDLLVERLAAEHFDKSLSKNKDENYWKSLDDACDQAFLDDLEKLVGESEGPAEEFLSQLTHQDPKFLKELFCHLHPTSLDKIEKLFVRSGGVDFDFSRIWEKHCENLHLSPQANFSENGKVIRPWKEHFLIQSCIHLAFGEKLEGVESPIFVGNCCHVKQLDLSNLPEIPDEAASFILQHFPCVETLNLSSCSRLGPQLLKEVRYDAKHLRKLNLSHCQGLTFELLENLFKKAPVLEELILESTDIDNDSLAALAPLSDHLRHLSLAKTQISDEGLSALPPFPMLRSLNLSNCEACGDFGISMLIRSLDHLEELNLSGCHALTHSLIDQLPLSLKHLNLNWCTHLGDEALDQLDYLSPALLSLSLAHCKKISNKGIEKLALLGTLESLDISFCSNVSAGSLCHLIKEGSSNLKSLGLAGLPVDDSVFQVLSSVKKLEKLTLPGRIDLGHLKNHSLAPLKELNLEDCVSLNADTLKLFKKQGWHKSLTHLNLTGCYNIDNECFEMICDFKNLIELSIGGGWNNLLLIDPESLHGIEKLKHLMTFSLSMLEFIDYDVLRVALEKAPQLKQLDLGPCPHLRPAEIMQLREDFPSTHITCFGYIGIRPY